MSHYLKIFEPSPTSQTVKLAQFQNSNKLSVSLGPPAKTFPKPTVSVKQLIDLRNTLGPSTSDNDIKNLATFFNKIIGKGTVEKNFQKKLRARYNYFKKDFQFNVGIAFEELQILKSNLKLFK